MKCALCKGEMVKGKTNLPYEVGEGNILVVRDVPAWVCRQCGESFVEIEVSRTVERLVAAAQRDGVTLGFIRYREAA
ncbi:MAG: type II toxin-antitoxin system MqsA family antitoxin [Candidatus Latescibacterota bacterium]|nr:MAG: type II toxin-antitoxin system MqsA family antitoxin [Candidatus Latescibacterota bacterium]